MSVRRAIPVSLLLYGSVLAVVGVVGHWEGLGAKPALPVIIGASGALTAVCGGLMLRGRRCRTAAEYLTGLGLYALALQAIITGRAAASGEGPRVAIPIAASVLAAASLGLLGWLIRSPHSAFGGLPPERSAGDGPGSHRASQAAETNVAEGNGTQAVAPGSDPPNASP